jgi:hypothetical protein
MTAELWVFLLLGGWIGYVIGRMRAENGRARFDMQRTWDGRTNYHKR